MANREFEVLLAEYARIAELHRVPVDVRFKLLALVPTVTGVAVAVLRDGTVGQLPIAALGMLVTLGVVMFEVRHSQLHDAAAHEMRQIARRLSLPVFGRPARQRLFGLVPVWHDTALGIVYGALVSAWAALLVHAANGWVRGRLWVAVVAGACGGASVWEEVVRMNRATKEEIGWAGPRPGDYPDPTAEPMPRCRWAALRRHVARSKRWAADCLRHPRGTRLTDEW